MSSSLIELVNEFRETHKTFNYPFCAALQEQYRLVLTRGDGIFRVFVLFLALRDFYRVHGATSYHLIPDRGGKNVVIPLRLSLMDEEILRINFIER